MLSVSCDNAQGRELAAMAEEEDGTVYPTPPSSDDESVYYGCTQNHKQWELHHWEKMLEENQWFLPFERWAALDHAKMIPSDLYDNRSVTGENYKSWPDLNCPALRSKRYLEDSWKQEFEETLKRYAQFTPLAHVQLVFKSLMHYIDPEDNHCGANTVYSSEDVFMHSITARCFTEATVWSIHVRCLCCILCIFDHMFHIVAREPDGNFKFKCTQTPAQRLLKQDGLDYPCFCHHLVEKYLCQTKKTSCKLSEVIALYDPSRRLGWVGPKACEDWYYYLRRYPAMSARQIYGEPGQEGNQATDLELKYRVPELMWENWDVKFGRFNPTLQQRQVLPPVPNWYADSRREQDFLETEFSNLPSTKLLAGTTVKHEPHIYEFCYIGQQSEWPSMRGWKPPQPQPPVSEAPLFSPDSYLTAPDSWAESPPASTVVAELAEEFARAVERSRRLSRRAVSADSSDSDTSD